MAEHNLGCGPLTIKYLVFLFNFMFFLSGLVLIVIGGIAQGFFRSYIDFFNEEYETPAIGIIILGSVILFISFFGCCGAKKENVLMLRIFAFLMVVVLLLEFAAAITVAVLRPEIETLVEDSMNKSMQNYGNEESAVTKTWDDLQEKYFCCGTKNYTDWEDTRYGKNVSGVPDSCCKTRAEKCGYNITEGTDKIYDKGCYQALSSAARTRLGAVIGGIVILVLIQMVGVWMSCCLIRAVKERYEIL